MNYITFCAFLVDNLWTLYAIKTWLGLAVVFYSGWLYPFPVLKYISHRDYKAFAWWISSKIMFVRYLYMPHYLVLLVKGSLSPIHNRIERSKWRHTKLRHIIDSYEAWLVYAVVDSHLDLVNMVQKFFLRIKVWLYWISLFFRLGYLWEMGKDERDVKK